MCADLIGSLLTFSLQLVTGTIYKTEPTVALRQTDLVSIET